MPSVKGKCVTPRSSVWPAMIDQVFKSNLNNKICSVNLASNASMLYNINIMVVPSYISIIRIEFRCYARDALLF